MENIERACIISCGVGGWYPKGVTRLERSLHFEGWPGGMIFWKDEYPPQPCYTHDQVPYYFKIAAFQEAFRRGFTHVMWLDASFWCVKNPVKIFDLISDQGYFFFSSGYNLAQSVNDRTLEAVGITRDEAETATEWATGCVGIRIDNPDGKALYQLWKEYMDKGLSIGSRLHDNQSSDPRFLFHRNDQSCFSLAAYKLGVRNSKMLDSVAYKSTNYNPEEIIFFIEGFA